MKITKYIRNSAVYFVIVTALIIFFFPRETTFRYTFVEGKPWQYGLLTAPFDFPVYKSAEQLQAEQDSALQKFIPYFQFNPEIYKRQQERFNTDYAHYSKEHWNHAYKT